MNTKPIKLLLIIYLIFYYYLFIVESIILGGCPTCRWLKYKFPERNYCIYYQKPFDIAIRNCTNYCWRPNSEWTDL